MLQTITISDDINVSIKTDIKDVVTIMDKISNKTIVINKDEFKAILQKLDK